ncbi:YslB family protein [Geobacillus sp. FSL W8-0032]|uniref:DUF2507 domain-containing protein n=1 Tax=Geobacillus subterraneus TaxID=129338 RepID=A0A679FRH0_9BACL|nr:MULTISPECIES: YslB family protein [Geobacillus]KYD26897.1 hypothetical protein B4113_0773 [Geobacillus sp. B4113_201601]BBW95364.1 hypothetical protein GsuE55_01970 [Geobacillus subterraneus]
MKLPSLEKLYETFGSISDSAFGAELLRHALLPELLGKDVDSLLYWAGKQLARRYPLDTLDEVKTFFERAGWGTLSIVKEQNDGLSVELSGAIIAARCSVYERCACQLEAGFLAQQIERQTRLVTEAIELPPKRDGKARIFVKWDRKQRIDEQEAQAKGDE